MSSGLLSPPEDARGPLRDGGPSAARVRAELVASGWELFSALLFMSAVVPAGLSNPWPAVIMLASIAVSASLIGVLARRGDRGYAVAAAIRTATWPLAVSPLLVRGAPAAAPPSWTLALADGASEAPPSWMGLFVAALAFGVMAGGTRRVIYRRILGSGGAPQPDASGPVGPGARAELSATLRPRLAESAMMVGIVGGHAMLLFSVAFLRTQRQVVFQAWFELVPLLALLGTLGFTLAVRPATHAILAALDAGPDGDRALLARGLAQAERLPDVLSYLNFALWLSCTAIGIVYVKPGAHRVLEAQGPELSALPAGHWSTADALMQLCFGALFAFGVSFYQRAWHRDSVEKVVQLLRAWMGAPPPRGEVKDTLRGRMLRDFGLPLLFTGLLSLFSAIGLYRALAVASSFKEDFNAITALFASFSLLVLAALGVVARAARELSRPMAQLARAADEVAHGKLDAVVPRLSGPKEVVGLGESVERMRQALSQTIAELEGERAGLEANVEARTAELTRALAELKRTQAALVHGERLALIGELVAGVAHEIYNPLNAIAGAAQPLDQLASELRTLLDAYREAEQVLPLERRRDLERLRAELTADASLDDLVGISTVIRRAVDRSVRIVTNLKGFSHVSGEALPVDLHAAIEETLLLLGPRLRHARVDVEKRYGELPPVTCRGGEINQVFMNLIVNALQAVEGDGHADGRRVIRIETWVDGDLAAVGVADSGPGVPLELAQRIFDPFFTTKPRGQGTGLGLSISTDIVRRHGGALSLERGAESTVLGELSGARFVVRLPLAPDPSATRPPDAAA